MNIRTNKAALLGFAVGGGFGLLRLAKADGIEGYLVATGLTLIEVAAVAGLDWFSEKRRIVAAEYRASQAQITALKAAVAGVDEQLGEEAERRERLNEAIRARVNASFDVDRVAEEAAWAVEAAYRSAINANQRLLEGGAVAALPPRTRKVSEG